jgi:hypothetical protein
MSRALRGRFHALLSSSFLPDSRSGNAESRRKTPGMGEKITIFAHPGRVREIIEVDLPRPRLYEMRSDKRFIALRDHVTEIVRKEAMSATKNVAA